MPSHLSRMRYITFGMLGSAAALSVGATPAFAGVIGVPAVEVSIQASDGTDTTFNPDGVMTGGVYNYQGSGTFDGFEIGWDFDADDTLDGGAFVGSNFDITNTSDETLTMTLSVLLPLASGGSDLTYFGSAGYTLSGFDGLLETRTGTALWSAMADGGGVASLFDDPFSDGFDGGGTVTDSDNLASGLTTASDSIGITLNFTLSPLDTVTFTGAFAVVPAPSAVALLAVGGLLGGRRRRN